jgi:hypothetical protein
LLELGVGQEKRSAVIKRGDDVRSAGQKQPPVLSLEDISAHLNFLRLKRKAAGVFTRQAAKVQQA